MEEYEKKDAKMKARPIYSENVYNNGIGNVDKTSISWATVNEMESRIVDENVDIEFFLAYKH